MNRHLEPALVAGGCKVSGLRVYGCRAPRPVGTAMARMELIRPFRPFPRHRFFDRAGAPQLDSKSRTPRSYQLQPIGVH